MTHMTKRLSVPLINGYRKAMTDEERSIQLDASGLQLPQNRPNYNRNQSFQWCFLRCWIDCNYSM